MKINPLDDRVVVRPNEAEETTAGGIVLPDAAKEKQQRGTVLAVGPGRLLDSGERSPISVKIGDQVLFGKYGGTEIEIDGEDVIVARPMMYTNITCDHRIVDGAIAAGYLKLFCDYMENPAKMAFI